MKSQNKILAIAAVMALALTAFALVPMIGDSDAEGLDADVQQIEKNGNYYLKATFTETLAANTVVNFYLDGAPYGSATLGAAGTVASAKLTSALSDGTYTVLLTVTQDGSVTNITKTLVIGDTPADEYTVTFDENVTITDADGNELTSPATVAAGASIAYVVDAAPAGQVAKLTINGTAVSELADEIEVNKNLTFVVTYEDEPAPGEEYEVTYDATEMTVTSYGVTITSGLTLPTGTPLDLQAIDVPEGQTAVFYANEVALTGSTYTIGTEDVEFTVDYIDPTQSFDLYLRDSKNPGVTFYLNGTEVTGTVSAKAGDILTVAVKDGYKGEPVVTIAGVAVENPCTLAFGGAVSVSGVEEIEYKEATLSGEVVGETVFADYQKVTVSGSCTLTEGAHVLVNGKLVIPEGTTLTVQAGAILVAYDVTVEGTLVIEAADEDEELLAGIVVLGAKSTTGALAADEDEYQTDGKTSVSGSIQNDGALTFCGEVKIAGSLTVGEDGYVLTDDVVAIVVEGTVTVYGASDAVYQNKGLIVFDSESDVGTGYNTILMAASGAVVTVENYAFLGVGDGLEISDYGATVGKTTVSEESENIIGITAIPTTDDTVAVVSGLEVVQTIGKIGNADASVLDVSGDVAVEAVTENEDIEEPAAGADLSIDGNTRVTVDDSLTVGEDIAVSNTGYLYVTGSVDLTAATFDNDDKIDVIGDGILAAATEVADVINATEYTAAVGKVTVYYYVTIDAALDLVNEENNSIEALEVRGTQTMSDSAALPADVVLTVTGTLNIGNVNGSDVQLTLADGSTLNGTGAVTVNGTLYAENYSDVKNKSNVYSDVFTQEMENGKIVKTGWAKWTNVYTALEQAEDGDVIEVTRVSDYTKITQNIEIPAGVTLKVELGVAPLLLMNGVTMTVKGVLDTEEDVYAEKMFGTAAMDVDSKESSAIVVEGVILTLVQVVYGDSETTVGTDYASMIAGAPVYGAYYMLDTQFAVSSVSYALENIADINGDIVINGAVSSDVSITGTSYCDTVVVSDVSVKDMDGKAVATVLTGTVVLDDATLDAKGTVNGPVSVGEGIATVEAAGFTATDDSDKLVLTGTFAGKTLEISAGTVTVQADASAVAVTVASGATMAAEGAVVKDMTVAGTLSVAKSKSFSATGTVTLTGSIVAEDGATASVATLNAGASAKDYTGAVPTVSGKVTVTGQIFASPSASIDEQTTKDLKSTTYYVDTTAFLVIYDATGSYSIYSVTKNVPVTNAYFDGTWKDADNKAIDSAAVIGTAKAVYANVVYEIYSVVIKADAGIDNVYLNGIAMSRGMVNLGGYMYEAFIAEDLTAGSYTVTYTLKNGYSGDATLYIDGKKQSSLSITASGNPADEYGILYQAQLSGIEKSGYVDPVEPVKSDDGLKVTDYLLIVLVILVVILAVIVALRLMRS